MAYVIQISPGLFVGKTGRSFSSEVAECKAYRFRSWLSAYLVNIHKKGTILNSS